VRLNSLLKELSFDAQRLKARLKDAVYGTPEGVP
jgi:hypothetical protein